MSSTLIIILVALAGIVVAIAAAQGARPRVTIIKDEKTKDGDDA